MRRVIFLLAGAFIILLAACDDYKIWVPNCEDSNKAAEVSFSKELEPIFESKCNSCHGGTYSPDLSKDWAYDELMEGGDVDMTSPCESNLYLVVNGTHNSHKVIEVDTTEMHLVKDWIIEGAENN